ncbi:MAG: GDSL-type esterase/lipase family protein [Eubacteriales bacterium]|nr:GDSL-type esterase/lipase family protein [Eubacteriales bacterium]
MKKLSKRTAVLALSAVLALGTLLSGCSNSADYTEEIKEYQNKLESLAAENEQLKAQLGITETETQESQEQVSGNDQQTVSENNGEQAQATESPSVQESQEGESGQETTDDNMQILVLGDSIWGNYRDDTGVSARVEHYLGVKGYQATVYNAAIGGTRATLDPDDNPYEFGPASENSLAKMISIFRGDTDVELLQGKPAYDDAKAALAVKDQIDLVILAYGMNDFLSQAPINDSDAPWTGFGTALVNGVAGVRSVFPSAKIMIITPSYASYFSIPVQNMGQKALYNYASVACDVAKGEDTLCMDAYNNLGIDAYNADEYIEDGVHLNEKGRDLYAQGVVSCLLAGTPGQVSGNSLISFDEGE